MRSRNKSGLPSSRVGDISELAASAWLLAQGYEVFRNVSCVGPVDIVAIKDGETILIDVATPLLRQNGQICPNIRKEIVAKRDGIKVLYVHKSGVCEWSPSGVFKRAAE